MVLMSWADFAKTTLRNGNDVTIRPRGQSMRGRVKSGDIVKLTPVTMDEVKVDDVVLVRVKGRDYLHLVKAKDGDRILIGNNRGVNNGWIRAGGLYGKAVEIASPE